ncbi:MOSC domain [Popillia japonica]|uniref:MOSC domain n=1 Tax=Popillia japonica TaxID=7064 RepID=A0AAW1HUC8_POPJA
MSPGGQYGSQKTSIPKNWTPVTKVKQLFVYPLKSGRRREVAKAQCTERGLVFTENNVELKDRYFIVYGEGHHEFKTARTNPKLIQIQTNINTTGDVVFTAPNQTPLIVNLPDPKNKPAIVTIHQKAPVESLDCGDEASAWFSHYLLEKPSGARLGYYRPQFKRNIKKQFPKLFDGYNKLRIDSVGIYSDLTSYLLINEASMDTLNSNLEEPVSHNNFRPNILVDGKNLEGYTEENWDWVRVGDAIFKNVKPCTRCILTTVDPERGVLSKQREPLKTLERTNQLKQQAHISAEGKKGVMGIHLELWKPGEIRIGDEVFIA